MKKNTVVAIAMVLVALLAALAIIFVVLKTPADIEPRMTGDVTSSISFPQENRTKSVHVEIPVQIPHQRSVLLVDESGSMDGISVNANTYYDSIVAFSDYPWFKEGNSRIAESMMHMLDIGVRDLGVVSDFECWPEDDIHCLDFKQYENVQVYLYCSETVSEIFLPQFKEKLTAALNPENCTLVFCYADGTKEVIYDSYTSPEDIIAETDVQVEPELVLPEIELSDTHAMEAGNYIAPHVLRNILIAGIAIIAFLVEVILALLLRSTEKEPEWVKKAMSTGNVALDGSGSVKYVYDDMLKYLKVHKKQIKSIWRFADDVKQVTLAEAKSATPGGQTHGWEVLSRMMDAGIQEVTIMSDMQFNDGKIEGLHFDKIVFIVPSGHDTSVLEELKTLASVTEVILL